MSHNVIEQIDAEVIERIKSVAKNDAKLFFCSSILLEEESRNLPLFAAKCFCEDYEHSFATQTFNNKEYYECFALYFKELSNEYSALQDKYENVRKNQ